MLTRALAWRFATTWASAHLARLTERANGAIVPPHQTFALGAADEASSMYMTTTAVLWQIALSAQGWGAGVRGLGERGDIFDSVSDRTVRYKSQWLHVSRSRIRVKYCGICDVDIEVFKVKDLKSIEAGDVEGTLRKERERNEKTQRE